MKKKLLLLIILLSAASAYGQSLHVIKFVYIGDEDHPVGTIVISVEKKIWPTDKATDDIFGQSIQTDMQTFETLRKLIAQKKYITRADEFDKNGYYKIIDSNGFVLLLDWPKFKDFFGDLRATFKKENLDPAVVELFKGY